MILIDNNLSPKLVNKLKALFPDICHVVEFGMEADDDRTVWNYAQANNLHILTKDHDFIVLLYHYGFPPKVIRLNCGNATTKAIEAILLREELAIKSFLSDPSYGLLVMN